jgi:hypothetical protein
MVGHRVPPFGLAPAMLVREILGSTVAGGLKGRTRGTPTAVINAGFKFVFSCISVRWGSVARIYSPHVREHSLAPILCIVRDRGRYYVSRMVCTRCGIIGADARPNWTEKPERESLTGMQWLT